MKPVSPHDPLDDLIAAALHGELTPQERAQFDSRINNDPAARAAYLEAQAMHDLLEKTHRNAQPDSNFEQRMVSGVRRKLQTGTHRETAWGSAVALWTSVKSIFSRKRNSVPWLGYALGLVAIIFVLAGVALGPITAGIKGGNRVTGVFSTITSQLATSGGTVNVATDESAKTTAPFAAPAASNPALLAALDKRETRYKDELQANPDNALAARQLAHVEAEKNHYLARSEGQGRTAVASGQPAIADANGMAADSDASATSAPRAPVASDAPPVVTQSTAPSLASDRLFENKMMAKSASTNRFARVEALKESDEASLSTNSTKSVVASNLPSAQPLSATIPGSDKPNTTGNNVTAVEAAPVDSRKLIRNANLDLEVKSFQETMDKVTAMTKDAGGYVDTSFSQKGGNGKLQGTVVVKVLPQNLDGFLLKLRDLGELKNQSVSTDDVTKDYFDTQARLVNAQRMETQLQDLLKRENGKVSDLLQVERELGRVRGEIEQMQGQLKLYDFQVQYATVTMRVAEKDLKQAAAYLLKERDDFSLFATDVEGTFAKSRQAAEDFKGQVLVATLNHNSGSDVSALLVVSVPPDQIDPFLVQIRSMGRVANFTRDTKRVAKDGGDSDQPADETLTEKDKIMVNVSIRSDDETRKQVALTVVTKTVDNALEQAKTAALANTGVEILRSNLNKAPEGESTAQLSVRVPGKDYVALMDSFRALGRTATLSIQRNDDAGPGASGDDAPVIVTLSLTDNDTPLQQTEMSMIASDVDSDAQQLKKDAATAGVEVKASSFERQPDGTELAQMTFRLPLAKYPGFLETLKKIGKVESLSVRRDDRPDQALTDDTAPAEISLQLHNQRDIVPDNDGLYATLRHTFMDGADALFGSVRVIGVCIAFLAPWVFTLALFAWIGRRIYVWRKG